MNKWEKVTEYHLLAHLKYLREDGAIVRSKEVDGTVAYYADDGRTQDEQWVAKVTDGQCYIATA